jgi:hypothetical protein
MEWTSERGRPQLRFGATAHDQGKIRRSGAPNPDRDTTQQITNIVFDQNLRAELCRISRPEREHRRAKVGDRARRSPAHV